MRPVNTTTSGPPCWRLSYRRELQPPAPAAHRSIDSNRPCLTSPEMTATLGTLDAVRHQPVRGQPLRRTLRHRGGECERSMGSVRTAVTGWGRRGTLIEVNGPAAPAAYLNCAIQRTRLSADR